MVELKNLTRSLQDSVVDAAVPMNGELHLDQYLTLLGGVQVKSLTEFGSLSASRLNGESVPMLLKEVVR